MWCLCLSVCVCVCPHDRVCTLSWEQIACACCVIATRAAEREWRLQARKTGAWGVNQVSEWWCVGVRGVGAHRLESVGNCVSNTESTNKRGHKPCAFSVCHSIASVLCHTLNSLLPGLSSQQQTNQTICGGNTPSQITFFKTAHPARHALQAPCSFTSGRKAGQAAALRQANTSTAAAEQHSALPLFVWCVERPRPAATPSLASSSNSRRLSRQSRWQSGRSSCKTSSRRLQSLQLRPVRMPPRQDEAVFSCTLLRC